MTAPRRIGAQDSRTRAALLDVTAQIMVEEGYAAATSRRVAARAGVKPALVHYYFQTMDDLYLALLRQGAEETLRRYGEALGSPTPLRALWELSYDPQRTALVSEFQALSNHRKAIRAEIASLAERFRGMEVKALAALLSERGIDTGAFPPEALALFFTATANVLVLEDALGLTTGHREALAVVERFLDRYEPRAEGRTGGA
jgi:AcrR family transcriptional regulator